MPTPALAAEFVHAYEAELRELEWSVSEERRGTWTRPDEVERRLKRVLRAIEDGAWSPSLQTRLGELERSKAELVASQLEATAGTSLKVVRLHPDMASLYWDRVAALERALWEPGVRQEASEALIERMVLTPDAGAPDRLRIELTGDVANILTMVAEDDTRSLPHLCGMHMQTAALVSCVGSTEAAYLSKLVAGTGFEPVTFRL